MPTVAPLVVLEADLEVVLEVVLVVALEVVLLVVLLVVLVVDCFVVFVEVVLVVLTVLAVFNVPLTVVFVEVTLTELKLVVAAKMLVTNKRMSNNLIANSLGWPGCLSALPREAPEFQGENGVRQTCSSEHTSIHQCIVHHASVIRWTVNYAPR